MADLIHREVRDSDVGPLVTHVYSNGDVFHIMGSNFGSFPHREVRAVQVHKLTRRQIDPERDVRLIILSDPSGWLED